MTHRCLASAPETPAHRSRVSDSSSQWAHCLKCLDDLLVVVSFPRVGIVPVTDEAARLYETWVGMGGEGIVLKEDVGLSRPAIHSRQAMSRTASEARAPRPH